MGRRQIGRHHLFLLQQQQLGEILDFRIFLSPAKGFVQMYCGNELFPAAALNYTHEDFFLPEIPNAYQRRRHEILVEQYIDSCQQKL